MNEIGKLSEKTNFLVCANLPYPRQYPLIGVTVTSGGVPLPSDPRAARSLYKRVPPYSIKGMKRGGLSCIRCVNDLPGVTDPLFVKHSLDLANRVNASEQVQLVPIISEYYLDMIADLCWVIRAEILCFYLAENLLRILNLADDVHQVEFIDDMVNLFFCHIGDSSLDFSERTGYNITVPAPLDIWCGLSSRFVVISRGLFLCSVKRRNAFSLSILYYLYNYISIDTIHKLVQVYLYTFILEQVLNMCYNIISKEDSGGCFDTLMRGGCCVWNT